VVSAGRNSMRNLGREAIFRPYAESVFVSKLGGQDECASSATSLLRALTWIVKASVLPIGWVLLGSVVAFAITPIWDDVYKRKIAPRIDELLAHLLPVFRKKRLAAELVQIILFKDCEVEVRVIPVEGKEAACLHSTVVEIGLREVIAFLTTDLKAQSIGVKRIVIFFDEGPGAYKLHRIEFADGHVEHVV
jgi:hypothetical protein